jgi:hypothetical protein
MLTTETISGTQELIGKFALIVLHCDQLEKELPDTSTIVDCLMRIRLLALDGAEIALLLAARQRHYLSDTDRASATNFFPN